MLLAVAFTIPLFAFADTIFVRIGAGETVGMAVAYGQVIFAGSILIFFTNIASVFQGTGRGVPALLVTALRTIVLTPLLAVVFAFNFGLGLEGIWWGFVAANVIGVTVAFSWARLYIQGLMNTTA